MKLSEVKYTVVNQWGQILRRYKTYRGAKAFLDRIPEANNYICKED